MSTIYVREGRINIADGCRILAEIEESDAAITKFQRVAVRERRGCLLWMFYCLVGLTVSKQVLWLLFPCTMLVVAYAVNAWRLLLYCYELPEQYARLNANNNHLRQFMGLDERPFPYGYKSRLLRYRNL